MGDRKFEEKDEHDHRARAFANALAPAFRQCRLTHPQVVFELSQLGVKLSTVDSWTRGTRGGEGLSGPKLPSPKYLSGLCLLMESCERGLGRRLAKIAGLSNSEIVEILGKPRHNLPDLPYETIGRKQQLQKVTELLLSRDVHLVTCTGPPGTGKTRLAQQVAYDVLSKFPDGVCYVVLAPISDPDLVIPTIARTITRTFDPQELAGAPGVPLIQVDTPLIQILIEHLRNKQILLVLDNFEQVDAEAAQVPQLLLNLPQLKVLATSREALGVRGEQPFEVLPMQVPPKLDALGQDIAKDVEKLKQYEAVQLFIEIATRKQQDQWEQRNFKLTDANAPAVAEICRRLDGLPLAIELAAARTSMLSPQEMLPHFLKSPLDPLTGGVKDEAGRHWSLRAAIDWSYDLLNEREQALFRRLAVFQTGQTLKAIKAVCYIRPQPDEKQRDPEIAYVDTVRSLVKKHLLRREEEVGEEGQEGGEGEGPRYAMLETIREYAREKLEQSGEVGIFQMKHAQYFLERTEKAAQALRRASQQEWLGLLEELEEDYANLRAALSWAGTRAEDGSGRANVEGAEAVDERWLVGSRLVGAMYWFWYPRGAYKEALEYAKDMLSILDDEDRRSAIQPSAHSAQHLRAREDSLKSARAKVLYVAGSILIRLGDHASARSNLKKALENYKDLGDQLGTADSLLNLARIHIYEGHHEAARPLLENCLKIQRESKDKWGIAYSLYSLGNVDYGLGDYPRARSQYEESLKIRRELGDKWGIAYSLYSLGNVDYGLGDYPCARSQYEESLSIIWAQKLKDGFCIALCMMGLARVTIRTGQRQEQAKRGVILLGVADSLLELMKASLSEDDKDIRVEGETLGIKRLGKEDLEMALAEGRAMEMEVAINYALPPSSNS